MRILDKYILQKFIATLIFALIAFCLIFIIVDLIENLDKFIDKNVPYMVVIKYYLYYLPYIMILSLPIAVLLASLFSVGQMTRNNEIIAMKVAGLSLLRILLPLIIFGFILSLMILYLAETFVPMTNEKKIDIYREYVQDSQKKRLKSQNDIFIQLNKGEWLNIGFFDPNTSTGHRVSIQKFAPEFSTILTRIDAPTLTWEQDHWVLMNCLVRSFDGEIENLERVDRLDRSDFHFGPAELSKQQRKHDEFSRVAAIYRGYRPQRGKTRTMAGGSSSEIIVSFCQFHYPPLRSAARLAENTQRYYEKFRYQLAHLFSILWYYQDGSGSGP